MFFFMAPISPQVVLMAFLLSQLGMEVGIHRRAGSISRGFLPPLLPLLSASPWAGVLEGP